jgi:hypothetical protein
LILFPADLASGIAGFQNVQGGLFLPPEWLLPIPWAPAQRVGNPQADEYQGYQPKQSHKHHLLSPLFLTFAYMIAVRLEASLKVI